MGCDGARHAKPLGGMQCQELGGMHLTLETFRDGSLQAPSHATKIHYNNSIQKTSQTNVISVGHVFCNKDFNKTQMCQTHPPFQFYEFANTFSFGNVVFLIDI